MTSRMRWTARAGVAALVVGVAAPAAWAATTWSPGPTADSKTGFVSGQYSWNYGSAASKVGTNKIAFAYSSDAGTTSSKQSVYARIGTVDPTTKAVTWDAPKLMSPKTQIADRITLGAGKTNGNVYTAWASQTKYLIDPAAPRVAYYRGLVNGTLTSPVKLSSGTGRVDYPVVTGAGNTVYVAYTNGDTGKITLKLSTDAGATFATKTLGSTTRDLNDGEGFGGWPGVCSDGTNFASAWLDGTGKIGVVVSKDSGGTLAKKSINPSSAAGGDDEGWVQCDAVGSRIGFTWNQDDGVYYAEYSTASNSFVTSPTKAYSLPGGGYTASYSGSVSLTGASTVGLAAPLCVTNGCDYTDNTSRIDLKWLESTNKGGAWGAPTALANSTVAGKYLNDSPSPIFFDATTRYVIYNGWQANYKNYRLYLTTGLS